MQQDDLWRLGAFVSFCALLTLAECLFPKRDLRHNKTKRWTTNFFLATINVICLKMLLPLGTASIAIIGEKYNIGLIHLLDVPTMPAAIISLILFDLLIYTQHVVFHHTPVLWRLHKIHHIDQDIDLSTAVRFHPLEMLLSALLKGAFVLIIGVPFYVVIVFDILLNSLALFNHANISLPARLDKIMRVFIVTPDMHRIHHSSIEKETNSNFGFNLSCWDRLFSTYNAIPKEGHKNMNIGLNKYQNPKSTGLFSLLFLIPFAPKSSGVEGKKHAY